MAFISEKKISSWKTVKTGRRTQPDKVHILAAYFFLYENNAL